MKKLSEFASNLLSSGPRTLGLILFITLIVVILFYNDNRSLLADYESIRFLNSEISYEEALEIYNNSEDFFIDIRMSNNTGSFSYLDISEGKISPSDSYSYHFVDYNGQTMVYFNDHEIFNEKWRPGYRSFKSMISVVKHGFIGENELLYAYISQGPRALYLVKDQGLIELDHEELKIYCYISSIKKTEYKNVIVIESQDFYRTRPRYNRLVFYDINTKNHKVVKQEY